MADENSNHEHKHDHTHEPVDFIEFDFTARTEEGHLFDTTISDTAKSEGIELEGELKPLRVPLSPEYMLKGLYELLKDKEPGKYTVTLQPDDAFGKKDAKLMKLMNLSHFKKHNVNPQVGMDVEVNDRRGTVRSVSSGRVYVDFNHPMAGRVLHYEVIYNKRMDDVKEMLEAFIELTLRMPGSLFEASFDTETKTGTVKMKIPSLPEEMDSELKHMAEGMIKGLDKLVIEYESPKGKDNEAVN
jgi:FKBP-type peptidyl-prolyl cis-trans isomerase 2